jgi:DNA-binding HxlR family transcriptional regulator
MSLKKNARGAEEFRSGCPIASALEIIGDRWTLVLLRDLVNGKTRSKQFLDSPERIASNILTARLGAMKREGLIERRLYQARPKRYEYRLTKKGAALLPVLHGISQWGEAHLPKRWRAPFSFMAKSAEDLA